MLPGCCAQCDRHTVIAECHLVGFAIEVAVGTAKARDFQNLIANCLVAYRNAQLCRFIFKRRNADQPTEDGLVDAKAAGL